MPLFFFHVYDGVLAALDEEGLELPGLDAARNEAIRGARSILSDDLLRGCVDLSGRIDIVGDDGTTLLTLPFSDAFEIKR
ncbi:MAG: hypothetical protein JWN69_2118 [Alphaproteobacteria bacterium]|jgi:hypothetical protein|nr:hypothetical protein [Alphaproteobacteria bacterium]